MKSRTEWNALIIKTSMLASFSANHLWEEPSTLTSTTFGPASIRTLRFHQKFSAKENAIHLLVMVKSAPRKSNVTKTSTSTKKTTSRTSWTPSKRTASSFSRLEVMKSGPPAMQNGASSLMLRIVNTPI